MRTNANEHAIRKRGVKLHNQVAAELEGLFDDIPKSVLAAIAVRQAHMLYDKPDGPCDAKWAIVAEWTDLHRAKLVPQEPDVSSISSPSPQTTGDST